MVSRLFGGVEKILQHAVGRLFIAGKALGELATPLRHGAQAGGVGQQFALRRLRRDDLHIVLRVHADDASAALVQISHDVAHILFGDGDLEVRERLQQDGIGVLDALLEGDFCRRLEGGLGRVDGVEASVIEDGPDVDNGVARQHAVGQALHQTLFNGGNILLGNGAAHDLIHELEVLLARLEADLAVAVLPVAARLFFVLALDVRFAADGLLVGNGGGAELGVRPELGFQFFLDDVEMHFALSAHQRLTRVGVFGDGEAPVLLGKAVEAAEYLVLRPAHGGIDRHEEHGLVEGDGVKPDGRALVAQRVSRPCVRKFADGADVARAQLGERLQLLAADEVDGADALRRSRVGVEHAHARLQAAAHHAQIVHLSHKRVDRRLEYLRRKGAVRVAGDAHDGVFYKVGRGLFGTFRRLGKVLDDLVHQVDDALVLEGAARHDGHDVDVEDTLADAVDHVLAGEETLFEILFKQNVVILRRRLGERELHLLVVAATFFGNGDLLGAGAREVIRLARQRVCVARHFLAVHDGDLDGGEQRLVFFAERRDGRGIVGVLLVHAVDENDDGLFRLQAEGDRLFRAHRHGSVGARHDDGGAAGTQRLGNFAFKVIEPGHVDEVDLDVLPGDGGDGEGDGHLARDLLFVKVGDGGAVFHFAHALDDAAVEEHRLKQGGLAFAAVPDDGYVADIFCRNTHSVSPLIENCSRGNLFVRDSRCFYYTGICGKINTQRKNNCEIRQKSRQNGGKINSVRTFSESERKNDCILCGIVVK